MLKSIVNASTDSKLIIIQDSASTRSISIFKSLISHHSKSESIQRINIIAVEGSQEELAFQNFTDKINLLPISDPLQWITSEEAEETKTFSIANISNKCYDLKESAVFIDSLNPFLWNDGIVNVARDLLALRRKARKVVCCLHKDAILQANDNMQLKHIATTHIDVLKRLNAKEGEEGFVVDLLHRKQDGRLDRLQKEIVRVDSALNLTSAVYTAQSQRNIQKTVDMTSLTTFNLGVDMKPSEREARDRLVLPYTKQDGGDVIYEADDADLEEDPDDDLEL